MSEAAIPAVAANGFAGPAATAFPHAHDVSWTQTLAPVGGDPAGRGEGSHGTGDAPAAALVATRRW